MNVAVAMTTMNTIIRVHVVMSIMNIIMKKSMVMSITIITRKAMGIIMERRAAAAMTTITSMGSVNITTMRQCGIQVMNLTT